MYSFGDGENVYVVILECNLLLSLFYTAVFTAIRACKTKNTCRPERQGHSTT